MDVKKKATIFSTRSEYGVMMLTDLAQYYGKGPRSLSDIATHLGLDMAYLEQIVSLLRKHGFVESTRGAKGGYVLTLPPETIKMGAVIRALEGRIAVMGCATDDNSAITCNHEEICSAPVLWLRVRDAITQALDSTTLADLAPNPRRTLTMALGSDFTAVMGQAEEDHVIGALASVDGSNN